MASRSIEPEGEKLLRLFQIALLSFAGAVISAALFVAVLQRSLPPTDAAYGQSLISGLWDPFVIGCIVLSATVSALLTIPVAYFCLRGRQILPCAALAFLCVAIEIVVVTPWFGYAGWFGSYAALLAALIYCRSSKRWLFRN
jgi:hypothetical protein